MPAKHSDVFCYDGQCDAVSAVLWRICSMARVHVVTQPEQLRGHEKFIFMHVKDHPAAIHEELWAMLESRRATVVEIDNSRVPV
jgi:hypothetical protein